jgi:uncharacterized protein YjiS (DUF1127 family)
MTHSPAMREGKEAPMHTEILREFAFTIPAVRATAALWLRRIATRSRLGELDARQLEDIGCSEEERRRECAKRFWQA